MSISQLLAATVSTLLLMGSAIAMGADPAPLADAAEKADRAKIDALLQDKIDVSVQ